MFKNAGQFDPHFHFGYNESMNNANMIYYEKAGWIDWKKTLQELPQPFIFVVGARGIGKSYGIIKECIRNKQVFLYLRRTETESKPQQSPVTSQISPITEEMGIHTTYKKIEAKIGVIEAETGVICYTAALSTFHNLRGISLPVDLIIYDEFVPEIHARPIKAEGIALSNLYETLNRNRELEGRPPLKMICLSNSLNIANDIFRTFNLIPWAETLMNNEDEVVHDDVKALVMPKNSRISDKKRNTVLYKATSEEYARMALKNEFIQNDFTMIKKYNNMHEWKCVLRVGVLYVYKHKSMSLWYVCMNGTCKKAYEDTIADLDRFRRTERKLLYTYWEEKVRFESYNCLSLFVKYFGV